MLIFARFKVLTMFKLIRSSILAGMAIGCGAFGFLASGVQSEAYGSLFGAVLFSFGLISVVAYKLSLYTGTAGFIKKNEVGKLFLILAGNIVGCFIMGMVSRVSHLEINQAAQNLLSLRLERGPLCCGLLGIPCGFMMTTAVTFARRQHYIPLLLAVPLFIVCGFVGNCDVFADCFAEKERFLHNKGHTVAQILKVDIIYVNTVYCYSALLRCVKTAQQCQHYTFAAARCTDDGDNVAFVNGEINVTENNVFAKSFGQMSDFKNFAHCQLPSFPLYSLLRSSKMLPRSGWLYVPAAITSGSTFTSS